MMVTNDGQTVLGLLQVTDTLALVLRQAGHSASRYAGRLFVPPSAVPRGMECAAQQMARTASEELRSHAVVEVGPRTTTRPAGRALPAAPSVAAALPQERCFALLL
jgi:hypothetical protein